MEFHFWEVQQNKKVQENKKWLSFDNTPTGSQMRHTVN